MKHTFATAFAAGNTIAVRRHVLKPLLGVTACALAAAPSGAAIVYVDATTSNTTLSDGTAYTPTTSVINDDDEWSSRSFGNGGALYTANDNNSNPGEDAPELRTTISGVDDGTYDLYAFFWRAGDGTGGGNTQWDLAAGLNSGDLTDFFTDGGSETQGELITADQFDGTVLTSEGDRRLVSAQLGQAVVTGGSVDVYIDDVPGNDDRSWYDGVGYELVPEPSSLALLGLGALTVFRRRRGLNA